MRFALVQGEVKGNFSCKQDGEFLFCLDRDILDMYPGTVKLDFVPNQGFRLSTDNEFLATHLRLTRDVAEI